MIRLVKYFVNNSFVVNIFAFFICFAGIIALFSMKRDLIPVLEWQVVEVEVTLPGASSTEIEKFVTVPIEEALRGLPGVEEVESVSRQNSSIVEIYYYADYEDMAEAVALARDRVQSLQSELPIGIRGLRVQQRKVTDVFLMFGAIENFAVDNPQHQKYLQRIEKKLLQVPGVVIFNNWNEEEDIYIDFDSEKLKKLEVSISEARQAIQNALGFNPVGSIRQNEDRYSIEVAKISQSLDKIAGITIRANRFGNVVRLSDVAKVSYRTGQVNTLKTMDGKPAVIFGLRKDITTDAINLKHALSAEIEKINSELPDEMRIRTIVDGPHFIQQQLSVLKKNGAVGFIFVILTLIFFLSFRTAVMTAAGLPIAYFGTLLVLYQMGINIDLLSIIGLILVLGILVDDAIIVSERYVANLEKGLKPKEAAVEAVRDLIIPVTGTILTTAVAFSPLLLIKSKMQVLLFAVPVIIITALALSWIEVFFMLPNHLASHVQTPPKDKMKNFFNTMTKQYERLLQRILPFRYLLLLGVLLVFGVSGYVAATKIKHNFELRVSSERLSIYVHLDKSESLEELRKTVKPIEDYLLSLPKDKVESVYSSYGYIWEHGQSLAGYRFAKLQVYLDRDYPYPTEIKNEMEKEISKKLEEFQTPRFEKLYVQAERENSDEEKNRMVKVKVVGGDEVEFYDLENEIVAAVRNLPEITDYVADQERYQKKWIFEPEYEKLAKHNFSIAQLTSQLRSIVVPDEVMEIRFQGQNVNVYTSLERPEEIQLRDLNNYEVLSPNGVSVPLAFLGRWVEKQALHKIKHYNGQRNLNVEFSFDDKKTNRQVVKSKVEAALAGLIKKYPNYDISVVDANKDQEKNMAWAFKVAALCIVAVLLVMALVLKSLTQPLLVGMPIPCGLIGIVWALYLHDMPLGIMALIGLVGTVGVAVNASLIMVDQTNKYALAYGGMSRKVIIMGASSRIRAIFLSTLTTLGGVIPMAYGIGGESGFTQPLAFSMGWGLGFATLLTLFVLPSLQEVRLDSFHLIRKIGLKFGYNFFENEFIKDKVSWELPQKEIEESHRPELMQ